MNVKEKELIIDVLLKELEAELDFNCTSEEVTSLYNTLRNYINTYLKGINKMAYNVMLHDLMGVYKWTTT